MNYSLEFLSLIWPHSQDQLKIVFHWNKLKKISGLCDSDSTGNTAGRFSLLLMCFFVDI